MLSSDRPHPNCYWVHPGRFLAGEYPGALCEAEARQKLARLLEAGVTFFLDLTAPHELQPYTALLDAEAQARGRPVVHRRLPILDGAIPHTPQEMVTMLDTIDQALAAGHTMYVHCWGSVGRTDTVVGCHLVRHGQQGTAALHALARRWQTVAKRPRHPCSPETEAQRRYILHWTEPERSSARAAARFERCGGPA